MQHNQIPFEKANAFSSLFLEYISGEPRLQDFIDFQPSLDGLKEALDSWSFDDNKRAVLVDSLNNQNQSDSSKVKENINLLSKSNTLTVTTGHQLNLATGPLYFIYKIVSTIKLANRLKEECPEKNFVPVYWMASEDHDFQEINHFNLFGKKYIWESSQTGAVGKFDLDGVQEVLDQLPEPIDLLEVYKSSSNLSEATRKLVDTLFSQYGLIIIDADQPDLKKLFTPVVKEELSKQTSYELVEKTSTGLTGLGFKKQVNPREVNLFYLGNNFRERIVIENERVKVLNSQIDWSLEEAISFFEKYPEKVSPNVILRPLYQQMILPNISYVGGPGELAYWFQLKELFHFYEEKVPVLIPRNFATLIPKTIYKKMKQLTLSTEDVFMWVDELKKKVVSSQTQNSISLQEEVEELELVFEKLNLKVSELDKNLLAGLDGEKKKLFKSLDKLERRLEKTEEGKYSQQIQLIETIKSKLFPNGKLQERQDNFLNFYLNHPSFINDLFECLDPLSLEMNVISYD